MLRLVIPKTKLWDPVKREFSDVDEVTIELEHSLISLSKWEAKHEKHFIGNTENLTSEELLDYIRQMTITKNVDPNAYLAITEEGLQEIYAYINSSQTATTIREAENKPIIARSFVTSELIYYWMISLDIPFECKTWHLNRLMTLIRVCNEKNKSQTNQKSKMPRSQLMNKHRAMNAANKARLGTNG